MRYDDDGYVKAYKERGEFPAIHNDIFAASQAVHGHCAVDLGCCTGLLAKRLSARFSEVIGIEPCARTIAKAITAPNIHYYAERIDAVSLPSIEAILRKHGADVVFARRVFPELHDTGGMQLVHSVAETFHRAGVKYIVLEGRKRSRVAKHILRDADRECAAIAQYYRVINKYREVRILERV